MSAQRTRKVYVVNNSGHDYSPAEQFGQLVYLSESKKDQKPSINSIFRDFFKILKNSHPDDLILDTGLPSMRSMAWAIMTFLHGKVNILIFLTKKHKKFYVERNIVFGDRTTLGLNDLITYEYLIPNDVYAVGRKIQPGDVIKILKVKDEQE